MIVIVIVIVSSLDEGLVFVEEFSIELGVCHQGDHRTAELEVTSEFRVFLLDTFVDFLDEGKISFISSGKNRVKFLRMLFVRIKSERNSRIELVEDEVCWISRSLTILLQEDFELGNSRGDINATSTS